MNAIPMIARCMEHNLDRHWVEEWLWAYRPMPHADDECRILAENTPGGPNLLLWTGRQHKVVLMLK